MKTSAINTVRQVPKSLWQKVKRPALIAAVALPTLFAAKSCCPLMYGPLYCPHPGPCYPMPMPMAVPVPVPVPVPIYAPPVPYYGPCCDTTSVETAQKKMDILG